MTKFKKAQEPEMHWPEKLSKVGEYLKSGKPLIEGVELDMRLVLK